MPDKPYFDAADNNVSLRNYTSELVDTIKHIHGIWAKPMYTGGVDNQPFRAKARPTVFQQKPDNASDECYIIGFQSKGGLTRDLIQDVQHYAEAIANEPEHPRIIYRGFAVIGNTVVVFFDKTPPPESQGLEKIAQQYKAIRRGEFIQDIITAARAAGVEDLLISHWPTKTS